MIYISLNAGISVMAKRALADSGAVTRPDVVFAGPQPALFWQRELIWRENGRIGRARYDLASGFNGLEPAVPDNMDHPLVRRARRVDREIIGFLRWSVLPIATIERSRCRAVVSFGDARFGSPRVSARFLRTVELLLGERGCPPVAGDGLAKAK